MKEYRVSYYLSAMYHSYVVEAENEFSVLKSLVSKFDRLRTGELLHDIKIERYYQEWN